MSGADTFEFEDEGLTVRTIVHDIRHLAVDAIVIPAVRELDGGGIIAKSVFEAGGASLMARCQALPVLPGTERDRVARGHAVFTPGPFDDADKLYAANIIHTVGPKVQTNSSIDEERDILFNCISECMGIALHEGFKTVVFATISCGINNGLGAPWLPVAAKANIDAIRAAIRRARSDTGSASVVDVTFVFGPDAQEVLEAWKLVFGQA